MEKDFSFAEMCYWTKFENEIEKELRKQTQEQSCSLLAKSSDGGAAVLDIRHPIRNLDWVSSVGAHGTIPITEVLGDKQTYTFLKRKHSREVQRTIIVYHRSLPTFPLSIQRKALNIVLYMHRKNSFFSEFIYFIWSVCFWTKRYSSKLPKCINKSTCTKLEGRGQRVTFHLVSR